MNGILHSNKDTLPEKHKSEHNEYEYIKREFLPRGYADQCVAAIYEIPPQKSAYPYHYHLKNEELFYIISGSGVLKIPEGNRIVGAGDLLFFPANKNGAHKLTNTSDSEMLVYLDFDTSNDIDVSCYPDSGKIGVWGKINQVYKTDSQSEYYDGE